MVRRGPFVIWGQPGSYWLLGSNFDTSPPLLRGTKTRSANMLAELKTKIAQIIFLIHISSTLYLLTGQRETGLKLSEQIKRDPSENIAGITYRNTFQLIGKDGQEIGKVSVQR